MMGTLKNLGQSVLENIPVTKSAFQQDFGTKMQFEGSSL